MSGAVPGYLAAAPPHESGLTRDVSRAVLGYLVAALSPNMDVANGALPAYVIVLLFFIGLLIRPQDQPRYWWAALALNPKPN